MTLKFKWFLIWFAQSLAPFLLLICGPLIGLRPKNHTARIIELVAGWATIGLLALWNCYAYSSERKVRELVHRLRKIGFER